MLNPELHLLAMIQTVGKQLDLKEEADEIINAVLDEEVTNV